MDKIRLFKSADFSHCAAADGINQLSSHLIFIIPLLLTEYDKPQII
jgi:hypothetical protein